MDNAKRRAAGAWVVDYVDQQGHRHIQTFERKKDADAAAQQPAIGRARRRAYGGIKAASRPLLLTAIFAGLRSSELRGLRWSDVDLKAAMLHVQQCADRYGTIETRRWATPDEMRRFGLKDCPLVHVDQSGEIDCYFTEAGATVVPGASYH
jgi:hypothetical protein